MSTRKKFGAFDGVFTPSILTILGVIMYLRMGWVVGNAGLWGAIIIVLIAHVISFSTGLSISSIATDKKVGAGGVYYVLSRSLGLPIGGAIGLTLFVGTALSISLYLVGFSESFNAYLGLSTDVNGLRSTGSLFLLVLTIIALISTSVAIKTQFLILAAIAFSLVSIFAGGGGATADPAPPFGGQGVAPMETVFAIFFPAVTGFTAGIAMSGDLKNPKKDLPVGTIAAISVGLVVYVALAVFLSVKVDQDRLISDYNILEKIAWFGPGVIAGVWGATLSSAIGGILGGPRILQAMSLDRITPRLFGRGVGLNNEPRNALLLTVLISEAGILIGELDLIARIVSMFYLAAYGFINISFFLESWASSDFKPSFKVSRWVGLTGFIATFAVMFKLDMLAMIAAFVIIGGVFLYLQRKQISLGTGDIWQSVWSTVVKSGLKRMEVAEDHKRNWKPNIILFSGDTQSRPHLIEFAKALAGQVGVITSFELVEKPKDGPSPKYKQNISDELLEKYGVFGRRIEVSDLYSGMETIATTFGFSGLDPNTVLMGWARNTQNPVFFTRMTARLIDLDYNVLYLDYDKRWGFRKREQIDMWWRGISNNAELMLHLARFISASPDWRNATIRVLLVNDFNVDRLIIENRIQMLLDEFRVQAEIKVINNAVEQKPFYQLMKTISAEADLVFIGIPEIREGEEESFVRHTNDLVGVIGTTLLVKASSTFETTELGLKKLEEKKKYEPGERSDVPELVGCEDEELAGLIQKWDESQARVLAEFCEKGPSTLQQHYRQWIVDLETWLRSLMAKLEGKQEKGFTLMLEALPELTRLSKRYRTEELEPLQGVLEESIRDYQEQRRTILSEMPREIWVMVDASLPGEPWRGRQGKRKRVPFQSWLQALEQAEALPALRRALHQLGAANVSLLHLSGKELRDLQQRLSQGLTAEEPWEKTLEDLGSRLEETLQQLQRPQEDLVKALDHELRTADRESANLVLEEAGRPGILRKLKKEARKQQSAAAEVNAYHQYWLRNQELAHKGWETQLQLLRTTLQLNRRKEATLHNLREQYVEKILSEISELRAATVAISTGLGEGEEQELEPLPLFQEEGLEDMDDLWWRFMKDARAPEHYLPNEVELMDEASRNDFLDKQGSEVSTVTLALPRIATFLITQHFNRPFRQQLLQLRQQLLQISGSVYNHGSLLNYGLEAMRKDQGYEELSVILEKAERELAQLEESTLQTFRTAEAEVKEQFEALEAMLEVDHLLMNAEELAQHVRKAERRRGLNTWWERRERQLSGWRQDWAAWRARHASDLAAAEYEEANVAAHSDAERLRYYMDALRPGPQATELPLYYRQLFTGWHLNLGRPTESRKWERGQVRNTLRHLREGARGGLMITGEALSGKSFFVEYVARHLLEGPSFHIQPPKGGSIAPRALQRAFEQAIGRRGSIESLLEDLPQSSVLMLDDIELWWLRQREGGRPLDVLINTVRQFGDQHFFLLTTNLDALKQLRAHSAIDQALLSTIILSPLSPEDLRDTLWARHKTGGVPLRFDRRADQELGEQEWLSLAGQIHKHSGGNIGASLWQWLRQIDGEENGRFRFQMAGRNPDFPDLQDKRWYYVLLQLYLHKSLSPHRFQQLFASEPQEDLTAWIESLHKAGVLKSEMGEALELHPLLRYHLGLFFKENSWL